MRRTQRVGPEVWAVLLLAMGFALLPILWGVSTAFKDNAVAEAFPPTCCRLFLCSHSRARSHHAWAGNRRRQGGGN